MWLLLILPIIILVVILLYISAAQSRKSYRCPKCGEKVRVEYMDTSRCGVCGAPLNSELNLPKICSGFQHQSEGIRLYEIEATDLLYRTGRGFTD